MLPVPGTRSRRFRVQKSRKTALTPLQVPPAITQDQERRTEGSQQPLKLWGRRSAERRRQPLVRWDLTSRFTEGGGFVMMGGVGGRDRTGFLPFSLRRFYTRRVAPAPRRPPSPLSSPCVLPFVDLTCPLLDGYHPPTMQCCPLIFFLEKTCFRIAKESAMHLLIISRYFNYLKSI
jgi:hypothetical protein